MNIGEYSLFLSTPARRACRKEHTRVVRQTYTPRSWVTLSPAPEPAPFGRGRDGTPHSVAVPLPAARLRRRGIDPKEWLCQEHPLRKQDFFKRSVPLKWVFVLVAAMVVIMVAIVVVLVLVDRDRDEARRWRPPAVTSSTVVTSPYDFAEMPCRHGPWRAGRRRLRQPPDRQRPGAPTSYGISSDRPAAQALSEAIRQRRRVGLRRGRDDHGRFRRRVRRRPWPPPPSRLSLPIAAPSPSSSTSTRESSLGVSMFGGRLETSGALVEAALVGNQ